MNIVGIDPGPEQSAYIELDSDGVVVATLPEVSNWELRGLLKFPHVSKETIVALEDMDPYAQRLGHELLRTIKWLGRFADCTDGTLLEITRRNVKLHLCGKSTATDADVSDALIERYGPGRGRAVGKKKSPGPLYDVKRHLWAALAVAVTALDMQGKSSEAKEASGLVLRLR